MVEINELVGEQKEIVKREAKNIWNSNEFTRDMIEALGKELVRMAREE